MRFLAREGQMDYEAFTVEKLSRSAYQEARKHQPAEAAQLKCENAASPSSSPATAPRSKHALTEIMLNALQANPKTPLIGVRLQTGIQ